MHAPQKNNNDNKNTSHWNNQRQNQRILWIGRGYNKLVLEIIKFLSKHRQSKGKVQLYFKAMCHYFGKVMVIILLLICCWQIYLLTFDWVVSTLCVPTAKYRILKLLHKQNFVFQSERSLKLIVCNRISWFCVIELRRIDVKLCKQ